jgi:hypothetical protein
MSSTGSRASGGDGRGGMAKSVGLYPASSRCGVRLLSFALLAALVSATPSRAQPDDDDEKVDQAPGGQVQQVFTDEQFDQWIFNNNGGVFLVQKGNLSAARQRLELLLALQVDDIERACKLTDTQKKQLQLIGRGDIKRFFVLYDKVKQKFQLVRADQQKMQQIWQDISPLQMMMQSGLFNEDSFLGRSLHNTLTAEQYARYDAMVRDRREFRHRAEVELAITVLEQNTPLRESQRNDLITLVSSRTKSPGKMGNYGYHVLMYQLSQIPEEKLKPFFDEAHWKAIDRQLNQFKAWGPWLKQSGQLQDEDDDADKADARPADGRK